jgi:response regulator NasT
MPSDVALRILTVSSNTKLFEYLGDILPRGEFLLSYNAQSAGEAMRRLLDYPFDIIVVNTPLPDEFGKEFAIHVAEKFPVGVLLLVKEEHFEQIASETEDYGILTLARPCSRNLLFQTAKLLAATHKRLLAMEKKTITLEAQMKEIRLINRAKWLLIQSLNMSEPEAHRYIEKAAMDKCIRRAEVAEQIIKIYGD